MMRKFQPMTLQGLGAPPVFSVTVVDGQPYLVVGQLVPSFLQGKVDIKDIQFIPVQEIEDENLFDWVTKKSTGPEDRDPTA